MPSSAHGSLRKHAKHADAEAATAPTAAAASVPATVPAAEEAVKVKGKPVRAARQLKSQQVWSDVAVDGADYDVTCARTLAARG
jgi:hypothetical protein